MSAKTARDEELIDIANSVLYLYDRFIESLINYAENNDISEADMAAALSHGYGDDIADSYVDGVEDYSA